MIEVVTRDRSPEMAQRYAGTYGFLKTDAGKKILVEIRDVQARYTEVTDSKGNNYTLASDTGIELEFTQVPSQWFQPDKDHIVYVTRKPDRQYKRGICDANTTLYTPYRDGTGLQAIGTDAKRVEAIFNPTGDSQAFASIRKIACGLWSKFFAWAGETVYVKDMSIGKVDHENKKIKLNDDMFLQEMRDALARSNSDYVVKVGE
jgi:hypothetical protein